jgi:hypothetical protein
MTDSNDPWTWGIEMLTSGHVTGPPAPPYIDRGSRGSSSQPLECHSNQSVASVGRSNGVGLVVLFSSEAPPLPPERELEEGEYRIFPPDNLTARPGVSRS